MGVRHYQDIVGVVQMYDDSISFFGFFTDLSNAIDFALVDWIFLLVFICAVTWILYQRHRQPSTEISVVPDAVQPISGAPDTTPETESDFDTDEDLVKQNPGHHAAVIRLIAKAETVEEIDSLFDNYINSPSHHKAYEIDVVTIHFLKKSQLLDGDDRTSWYGGERTNILRRYAYTHKQFIKAMSDAWEKYPELKNWN